MKTIVDGVTFDVDPAIFRKTCEGRGVTFSPSGGRLTLAGPEAAVQAARSILDASAELETAIVEQMYAACVAWYAVQIKRVEAREFAAMEKIFAGAAADTEDESAPPGAGYALDSIPADVPLPCRIDDGSGRERWLIRTDMLSTGRRLLFTSRAATGGIDWSFPEPEPGTCADSCPGDAEPRGPLAVHARMQACEENAGFCPDFS